MAFTLKTKFVVLGVALVVIAAFTEWLNYRDNQISADQQIASTVLQRHMDADMKHDGIRGNVYSAMVASKTGNQELLKESQDEVKNMSEEFAKDVDENMAANIPTDIKAQFGKIKESVAAYTSFSQKISQETKDFDKSIAMLPEFNKVFGVLEEDQGKATEMLAAWSTSLFKASEASGVYLQTTLIVLFVFAVGLPIFAMFSIFKPLNAMMGSMQSLSEGNIKIAVPFIERKDEMGDMARTVQIFKENAHRVIQLGEEQKRQEELAEAEKRKEMENLASQFESNVKNVVDMVASAATQMEATSKSVGTIADNSKNKLKALTIQLEGTTRNVQTVSSTTAQLSAAIGEITQQVSRATIITGSAVSEAQKADVTVQSLTQAAQKIGEVLEMINSIAAQINLLALNATIEAARAGDAGKGFAVVASEVKALAGQTTKATEEISQYIDSIQGATSETVGAIKSIGGKIREINDIATTIAAAVEQQGAATRDIASNVQLAAHGTQEVSRSAADVSSSSQETGEAAGQMVAATGELSRQSETLRHEVDKFLVGIRQG